MARFTVTEGDFSGRPTVVLANSRAGVSATVALQGATLLEWQAPVGGKVLSLIDGYGTAEEFDSMDGIRSGVLAPFPNRIADARYQFGGESYDLQPGEVTDRLVYHGFLRSMDLEVISIEADDDSAKLVLATSGIRPGSFDGYPFSLDLTVTYLLRIDGVELEVTARNVGDQPAPYACGWHPYFRLGRPGFEGLELQVPASTIIRAGSDLIPLAGDAAYVSVNDNPQLDFRRPAAVGTAELDTSFTDLDLDPDGRARTVLSDPQSGASLSVWQERGIMHVFTADLLRRDRRGALALEPVEAMTNSFNRSECEQAITLQPGQSRSFRCGVDLGQPPAAG
jgi:aldose 1-epimerase